jgi:hypothetical protein
MADSNQQIACGAVIGVPIVVSFVALLFYLFYAPAKVLITSFLTWLDGFVLWKLWHVAMACLTFYSIVETWTKLGTLELSPDPPSDRCVALFFAVTKFIEQRNTTSALYAYDENYGTQSVRLCTDAPVSVVSDTFGSDVLLDFPDFNGCSFANVAGNCTTVDKSNPNAPVPTCTELLQTPPLPYGFLYKSTYSKPTTGCAVQFKVQQDLPSCTYATVYRLGKTALPVVRTILAVALAVSSVIPFFGVWIIYRSKVMMDNNEPQTEKGDSCFKPSLESYAFAMETPFGELVQILQCCNLHTWNPPEKVPPLTFFWFAMLQADTLIEAAVLPILAVSGCPLCSYPKIYVIMLYKIFQFCNTNYQYWRQHCKCCDSGSGNQPAEAIMQEVGESKTAA